MPKLQLRKPTLALVLALLAPAHLPAQQSPPQPGIPGNPGVQQQVPNRVRPRQRLGIRRALTKPEVQKTLGISDEQRRKLDDLTFNTRKAAIAQRAALKVERLELRRLMEAASPDRAAIDKKIQEMGQTRSALQRNVVNGRLDLRAALTKDQLDRIREYSAEQPQPNPQADQGARQRIDQLQQRLDRLQQQLQNRPRTPAGLAPEPPDRR